MVPGAGLEPARAAAQQRMAEALNGTRGRTRTGTVFPPGDFESPASTNFATRAGTKKQVRFEAGDSAQARLQIQ